MPDQEKLQREIAKWVNEFQDNREQRKLRDEEDVKSAIIQPLLKRLGWDVNNPSEVKKEQPIGSRFADYALKIDGETKLIIEAKALDKNLGSSEDGIGEYERQAINYAYNLGIDWALLTNGEEWRLYNAYWKKRKLAFKTEVGKFPKRDFSEVSLLSKESLRKNEISEYFEEQPKRPDVNIEVTQELLEARSEITKSAFKLNPEKDTEDLRQGIQTLLDRLLFMKICEDRGITEKGQLKQVKEMVKGDPADATTLSDALSTFAFNRFRKIYNGGLFEEDEELRLEVENSPLRNLIDQLYVYDFSSINVDILGNIYEDYLGNVLEKIEEEGVKWVEDDTDRKEHGQFYTPQYIVDHIIDSLDLSKDDSVLDPACGSGAFLIKAYDYQKELYASEEEERELVTEGGYAKLSNFENERNINKKILRENIHGVDLNEEAVELSRINLWLRSIQEDTPLNKLDHNLRSGNSLLNDDNEDIKAYFDEVDSKANFDFVNEFESIMDQGGFDAIVGNPPWGAELSASEKKYLSDRYDLDEQNLNVFECFIRLGLELLNDGGRLGFLIPRNFIRSSNYEDTRQIIAEETRIIEIKDFAKFPEVTQECVSIVIEKTGNSTEELKENIVSLGDSQIPQEAFIESRGYVFNLKLNMEKFELLNRLKNQENSLNHYIETARGEEISKNGYIIQCTECNYWNRDSKKKKKKCKNCGKKFLVDEAERDTLINDRKGSQFLVGRDINKFNLSKGRFLTENPPQGISYKDSSIYQPPKLVMMAVHEELVVGFSDSFSMFTKNIYSIRPKEGYGEDELLKIEGLMNSSLYEFYHRNVYTLGAEYTIYIPQSYVRSIPCPRLQDLPEGLSEVVRNIEEKNSELESAKTNSLDIIERYSGKSTSLGDIIEDDNFCNEIETSSSANIKDLRSQVDENVLTIEAKVYDGWREVIKLELEQKKAILADLYLSNLESEDFDLEGDRALNEKVKSMEIPGIGSQEVTEKIIEEYEKQKEEESEIKNDLNYFLEKLDDMIFRHYNISDEQREVILSELESRRASE
jgi:type I restriction-modification system DNA methylase subunit